MSRRFRTAALVSATTLMIGGSLALGLAPTASAAGLPALAQLSVDKQNPTIGQTVFLSGTLCLGVNTKAASDASPAADPGGDPGGNGGGGAADPLASSVDITVTTPSGPTDDTATPDLDGTWTADNGVRIDQAGTYTFNATCDAGLGNGGDYDSISIEVEAQQVDPSINVSPSHDETVAPGGRVTLTGSDFTGASKVDVELDNVGSTSAVVDAQGGFSGVSFTIPTSQATATLAGTVTPDGGLAPLTFSVSVVAPTPTSTTTPPVADGTVTNDDDTSGSGYGSGYTPSRGYTASKPTLPNTGTDSLWPGVVGALLVVSGAGLVWSGRRREQAGTHAA